MLVLGRNPDQDIVLFVKGEVVATVKLLSIRGNKAILGFEADADVRIMRKELLPAAEDQKQAAAVLLFVLLLDLTGLSLEGFKE